MQCTVLQNTSLREISTDAMGSWKANYPLPSTMGMPEGNKGGMERYFFFCIKQHGSERRIKTLRFSTRAIGHALTQDCVACVSATGKVIAEVGCVASLPSALW